MKKLISVAALGAALALAAPVAFADDDNVQLDQLPDEARTSVEREVGDGEIREIDEDHDGDRKIYEVEYVEGGQRKEVDVAEDGRVVNQHRD